MKSIELTEEHKSKLLEMGKALFPEYPDLQFGVKEKHNWSKEYLVFGLTGNEPIIHWFEFCMTHLVEKLNNLSDVYEEMPPYVANVYGGANGKWNLYVKFHFHYPKNRYKKHPIDYLYSEFLKLSK